MLSSGLALEASFMAGPLLCGGGEFRPIVLPMSSNHADMAMGAGRVATMAERTIGVIGLGLMGEVLAGRLMAAGFGVLGYDIDPAKNARLAARGGQAAASPAEVARCGTIALAVFNTDQVEEVVEQALLPAAKPGTVVLCTTTCDPDRIEALGGRLAGTEIRFLETPVSGTSEQVRSRRRRRPDRRRSERPPRTPSRCSMRCFRGAFTSARPATAAAPSSRSI